MRYSLTGSILGTLEKQVMELVWKSDHPMCVAEVTEILSRKRPIAYTTIMTIMTRLVNKGILTRELHSSKYLYHAQVKRDEFAAKAIHAIFAHVLSSLGEEVVVHFINEIQKMDPKKKQKLIKLLEQNE